MLSKITIHVPLTEFMKIYSQYEKVKILFTSQSNLSQNIDMVNHSNHTHPKPQKALQIIHETKYKSIDVRVVSEGILTSLDKETKEEMRKVKYEEYLRENRAP